MELRIDQSTSPEAGLGRYHCRVVWLPCSRAFFVLAPPWLKISYMRNMPLWFCAAMAR